MTDDRCRGRVSRPVRQDRRTCDRSERWSDRVDLGAEERRVAPSVEPPADAEAARKHEVAEATLGVDLASEADVLESLRAGIAPAQGADGSYRAVFVDAQANLGALGRKVEASDDDGPGLGSPGHAAVWEHSGRREHHALDRGSRRRR